MARVEGVAPQNADASARGVSLTHPERTFLDLLSSPLGYTQPELGEVSAAAGFSPDEAYFVESWVLNEGVFWMVAEDGRLDRLMTRQVYRHARVRRLINAAAEIGLCPPTTATKDELEDYYTQRLRSAFLCDTVRDNAAAQLAKLKGFYPDEKGKGGTAAVQIILANPYGEAAPKVVAEVVNEAN